MKLASSVAASALNSVTKPDERTEDQYRSEVVSYVESWRKVIDQLTERTYTTTGVGRFRVRLINPTKRTFERVVLEVTIPGDVWALSDYESDDPDPLPSRPHKFGERRLYDMNFGHVTPLLLSRGVHPNELDTG
jgi:hypothetical protein